MTSKSTYPGTTVGKYNIQDVAQSAEEQSCAYLWSKITSKVLVRAVGEALLIYTIYVIIEITTIPLVLTNNLNS